MFEKKKQEIRSKKQLKKNQTTQPNHNQKAKPPKPAISDAFAFVRRFARCSRPAIIGTAGSRIGSVQCLVSSGQDQSSTVCRSFVFLLFQAEFSGHSFFCLCVGKKEIESEGVSFLLLRYMQKTKRKQKENKKKQKKKVLSHITLLCSPLPQ